LWTSNANAFENADAFENSDTFENSGAFKNADAQGRHIDTLVIYAAALFYQ